MGFGRLNGFWDWVQIPSRIFPDFFPLPGFFRGAEKIGSSIFGNPYKT
jgi:hypothetical protein